MFFSFNYLLLSQKSVPLQCVFHSIRFKVNKGWSKALLLFLFCTVSMRTYMKNILSYTKKGARNYNIF
jgi:hypothetical protein